MKMLPWTGFRDEPYTTYLRTTYDDHGAKAGCSERPYAALKGPLFHGCDYVRGCADSAPHQ